jgi:hypothetical protein
MLECDYIIDALRFQYDYYGGAGKMVQLVEGKKRKPGGRVVPGSLQGASAPMRGPEEGLGGERARPVRVSGSLEFSGCTLNF